MLKADSIIALIYIILAGVGIFTHTITLGVGLLMMICTVYGFKIYAELHAINERYSSQKDPWD